MLTASQTVWVGSVGGVNCTVGDRPGSHGKASALPYCRRLYMLTVKNWNTRSDRPLGKEIE